MPKRERGLGQFADLTGGLARKRGGEGDDTPMHTMTMVFYNIIILEKIFVKEKFLLILLTLLTHSHPKDAHNKV